MARRLARSLLWPAAWCVFTTTGTLLHIAADGPRPLIAGVPFVQTLANTAAIVVTPGWALLWKLRHRWPQSMLWGALFANAVGWAMILIGLWAAWRVLRWLVSAPGAPAAVVGLPDSSRRRFLVQGPAAMVGLVGAGSLVDGACVEPWDLRLRRYSVRIRDLPAGIDGLRIVQLADTHLGPRVPASYISSAVQRAIDLKPDLFALTGDYIHTGARFVAPAAELFVPLARSGVPIVGVLGNHDWYGDGEAMSRTLSELGVHMIDNRRVWLDESRRIVVDPPRGPALCIAGVGDLITDWVDVAAALDGLPSDMPRLLLSHEPDVAEIVGNRVNVPRYGPMFKGVVQSREPNSRLDLMLCGHTHGGQVVLPIVGSLWTPSLFGARYLGGLVQGPGFPVIISRGVGMSIIPIRLGCPPELVEITLTRA